MMPVESRTQLIVIPGLEPSKAALYAVSWSASRAV